MDLESLARVGLNLYGFPFNRTLRLRRTSQICRRNVRRDLVQCACDPFSALAMELRLI